ncbi:hypothetical protein [Cognaticolwellia beringensis]|uniref:Uncharacterized protein n=1 Tax=Cognaticolwellia beringensis TaxID=1967665 RepID=A0A222G9K6_9GAMM|nr:hypothetical protein [Cognaticolwellia beringensis]ASP48569.1 hypothetical protein B5D82_12790 [Cognaticolwellia beringensis]
MLTTILSAAFAFISLFLIMYMRNMEEGKKPTLLIGINATCLIGIIALNAFSQIKSSNDSDKYKRAVLELDVLAKINQYMIPASEQVVRIINNYEVVQEFIYVEKAIEANPDASKLLSEQQKLIVIKPSFKKAEHALDELKEIAAHVQSLAIQYPKIVPQEAVSWSTKTLKIQMFNLNQFIDPYARHEGEISKSVIQYMEDTGMAFGISVGKVRELSEKILSP